MLHLDLWQHHSPRLHQTREQRKRNHRRQLRWRSTKEGTRLATLTCRRRRRRAGKNRAKRCTVTMMEPRTTIHGENDGWHVVMESLSPFVRASHAQYDASSCIVGFRKEV